MYLVAIAWMYVALMMAIAEATHANGSLLGAIITFLLYGVGLMTDGAFSARTPSASRSRWWAAPC